MLKIYRKTPRFTNSTSMFESGARVGRVEERERIYVVADGELVSLEELRHRDRRFARQIEQSLRVVKISSLSD